MSHQAVGFRVARRKLTPEGVVVSRKCRVLVSRKCSSTGLSVSDRSLANGRDNSANMGGLLQVRRIVSGLSCFAFFYNFRLVFRLRFMCGRSIRNWEVTQGFPPNSGFWMILRLHLIYGQRTATPSRIKAERSTVESSSWVRDLAKTHTNGFAFGTGSGHWTTRATRWHAIFQASFPPVAIYLVLATDHELVKQSDHGIREVETWGWPLDKIVCGMTRLFVGLR